MHQSIHYRQFKDPYKQAIRDMRNWFGVKKYKDLTKGFTEEGEMTFTSFRAMCSLGGVEGYPVAVWYNEIWPEASKNNPVVQGILRSAELKEDA